MKNFWNNLKRYMAMFFEDMLPWMIVAFIACTLFGVFVSAFAIIFNIVML